MNLKTLTILLGILLIAPFLVSSQDIPGEEPKTGSEPKESGYSGHYFMTTGSLGAVIRDESNRIVDVLGQQYDAIAIATSNTHLYVAVRESDTSYLIIQIDESGNKNTLTTISDEILDLEVDTLNNLYFITPKEIRRTTIEGGYETVLNLGNPTEELTKIDISNTGEIYAIKRNDEAQNIGSHEHVIISSSDPTNYLLTSTKINDLVAGPSRNYQTNGQGVGPFDSATLYTTDIDWEIDNFIVTSTEEIITTEHYDFPTQNYQLNKDGVNLYSSSLYEIIDISYVKASS